MTASRSQALVLGVIAALIAGLLFASGFLVRIATEPAAEAPAQAGAAGSGEPLDYNLLGEIVDIIEREYVQPELVDEQLLYDGAIQGIFTSLADPHSTYLDPQTFAISRDDFSGAFSGIGASVAREGEFVIIVAPIPETPAERAGIVAGDIILAVDGEDAHGWSVQQAVARIRGPIGTTVELHLRHADGTEETFTIERDEIPQESVTLTPPTGTLQDANGEAVTDIGYVYIRSFTRRTPQELTGLLQPQLDAGIRALIIDVRSNPGGLLLETAQVADMFLDDDIILVQANRDGSEQEFVGADGQITEIPIVILQDEFSASGSEVLAAALQENDRATVVGANSFGKGTVNNVFPLDNGGAVYVSIARWLTPDRNQIEGAGITPDIEVRPTPDEIEARQDVALYRALDVLRGQLGIPAVAAQ